MLKDIKETWALKPGIALIIFFFLVFVIPVIIFGLALDFCLFMFGFFLKRENLTLDG